MTLRGQLDMFAPLAGGVRVALAQARRERVLKTIGAAAAESRDGWARFCRRQLAEILGCTPATAGKDLIALEDAGRILRDHEFEDGTLIGFKLRLVGPQKRRRNG